MRTSPSQSSPSNNNDQPQEVSNHVSLLYALHDRRCCCACITLPAREPPNRRPNFVIFYVDDLGWADTSVRMMDDEPLSASDFYQTPALERLAKQGMRFTSGYAPTPTCTGSRISIQFGMTSARLQYRNVFDVLSKKQRPARLGRRSLDGCRGQSRRAKTT